MFMVLLTSGLLGLVKEADLIPQWLYAFSDKQFMDKFGIRLYQQRRGKARNLFFVVLNKRVVKCHDGDFSV